LLIIQGMKNALQEGFSEMTKNLFVNYVLTKIRFFTKIPESFDFIMLTQICNIFNLSDFKFREPGF